MLGAGAVTDSSNRHHAAGWSPVMVVGKSDAQTVSTVGSVRRAAAARRQAFLRHFAFIRSDSFRYQWFCVLVRLRSPPPARPVQGGLSWSQKPHCSAVFARLAQGRAFLRADEHCFFIPMCAPGTVL